MLWGWSGGTCCQDLLSIVGPQLALPFYVPYARHALLFRFGMLGQGTSDYCFRLCTCSMISRRATLAVPTANVPKTMSIGPYQYTASAPMTHPARGQTKIVKNLASPTPTRRSSIMTPRAKPAAVATGAATQLMAWTTALLDSAARRNTARTCLHRERRLPP